MNRDESWKAADISTALMADPKVVALARQMRDPIRTAAALTLYVAVVLASWHEGTRVTIDAAQPAWWTDPADDLVAGLVAVNLIDGATRTIPLRTWRSWYLPAAGRRRDIRRRRTLGGLMAHGASLDTALAELNRRDAEWLAHLEELEPAWTAEYDERQSLEAQLISSSFKSSFRSPPVLPQLGAGGAELISPTSKTDDDGRERERHAAAAFAAVQAGFTEPPGTPKEIHR